MEALVRYAWPGNVREVRNVVERTVILGPGGTLSVELPTSADQSTSAEMTLEAVRRQHIAAMLD